MNLKEKLAELLEEARDKALEYCGSLNEGFGAWYAKYLIDHGVVIPVRCKECKHYKSYGPGLDGLASWGKCLLIDMDVDMPSNGYCCFGERKEE